MRPDPDLEQLGVNLRVFVEDDDVADYTAVQWDWDSRRPARLQHAWELGRWRG
ncbi:hypothetical protein [Nocardia sp.]|uniref:hypothetical protein n=1 Tax=Nocardia sp. TaxID=1821 RepID=UPI00261399B3|nr:hypothetical protein [Nocardia sp.]